MNKFQILFVSLPFYFLVYAPTDSAVFDQNYNLSMKIVCTMADVIQSVALFQC